MFPTESSTESDDVRYLQQPVVPAEPQSFWQNTADERLTVLKARAKTYLSIPASSASVERLFSVAGAIIRARRSSFASETVESLIRRMEMLKND